MLCGSAWGATYYVASDASGGNGANSGTPWTIEEAIDTITGGPHTVIMAAGTYTAVMDSVAVMYFLNKAYTGLVTFQPAEGAAVTISSNSNHVLYCYSSGAGNISNIKIKGITINCTASGSYYPVYLRNAAGTFNGVELEGCTITSGSNSLHAIYLLGASTSVTANGIVLDTCTVSAAKAGYDAVYCDSYGSLAIDSMTITATSDTGIQINKATDVTITNSSLATNNEAVYGYAIYCNTTGITGQITITDNRISNCNNRGIYIQNCSAATGILVERNTIGTITGSGYGFECVGVNTGTSQKGVFLKTNTINTGSGSGIIITTSDYCVVQNNIVYGGTGTNIGIYFKGSTNSLCENNTIYNYPYGISLGKANVTNDWPADRNCSGIVIRYNALGACSIAYILANANQSCTRDYNAYVGNTTETHGINADPQFKNVAAVNYTPNNVALKMTDNRYIGAVQPANSGGIRYNSRLNR